jgi:protein SCO1
MAQGDSKFISRTAALIVVIALPIILYTFFMMLTREAKQDLKKVEYPSKIKPVGLDTVEIKGNKVVQTIYYTIPDFSFTNQYGQTITAEDLKGKIFVADFFFTHCPTICPKMSASMKSLQDEFIRDDKFLLLSHTIDPRRDSVQRLKEYADSYGAVPGKWHFLTGDKDELYEQARAYLLAVSDESDGEDHDFTHTERFVLVDPELNIRGYYYGTDQKSINQLKGDIVLLLEEYKRK